MAIKHPFRKKWGQNFLKDPNIITKIIQCIEPNDKDIILEIGPGDGALTDQLIDKVHHIHGVEIDPLLIKYLSEKQYTNVSLYKADILGWDFSILSENYKIIGNLPYYISSPILFHLLSIQYWKKMALMFQKEVAQRIVAKPGNKSYSRLSIICQVYTNVKIEFSIPRSVFYPKPNVDSSIVTFTRKRKKIPEIAPFSEFIKQSFSQRRKKLKNNLPNIHELGLLNKWANMRPEELSPTEYIELFQRI